jgi:hypothetical protein
MKKTYILFGHRITICPVENIQKTPAQNQTIKHPTPLQLMVALREAGYRYPYSEIAREIGFSRAAVWNECNNKKTSKFIRKRIADILRAEVDDVFPLSKEDAGVA